MLGRPRCLTFGAKRVDTAIAGELLLAIQPIAVEAALHAENRYMEQQSEQQRIVELELQQARYEASLAERRYAACDPDNRLIAAQLEKSWETALQRVQDCEARLAALQRGVPPRRAAGLHPPGGRSPCRVERARGDYAHAPASPAGPG